ncbi:girdin isoform X2 [Hippoglossus stenolepis]|uniref:girdin isoform X2 n=1 Tax=Hippoglossus stenolepis TaxID=195615 RepID=UPI001FAE9F43|nr:girdin isoform X2 [Hippoglossus stenolepis]
MESGVFLPCLDQFMLSPLVTWVKTFVPNDGGMYLDFSELLDGVFLNDIMTQINPSATPQGANNLSRDPSLRIHNLNFLVQQIKTYYLDNLRQLIMIPLPNVLLLGRTPYCEQSLEEMKKLLLLLLGCAVQCERKEEYIERIQTLDFVTRAAIAAHIQELTHSQENVLDLQWLESSDINPDEMEAVARNMATHLRHLLDQRDAHLETIAELMQEKDGVVSLLGSPSSPQSGSYSPSIQQQQQAGSQQHLAVELADSKAKIRRLRQELEEKSEQMLDCRHELENMESELKRIQQENTLLLVEARAARSYRDELDALRERAIKADKLESEVGRYREQLHKMEFYKAKVEELKEDNRMLQETKEVLEDQLAGWRARSDKIHQLEKHSLMLKAQVHDMEQEREADRRRIEELQEENLTMCLAQRRSMEESQHLGWELEQLSMTTDNSQGQQTLSVEVSERTRSQMLKLEKENQSLLRTIEELRAASTSNSLRPKQRHCRDCDRVDRVVCDTNNWSPSTDEPSGPQTSCSNTENHTNIFPLSTAPQQILNGDSNSHRRADTVELEGVQSEILLTDDPERHIQEKGQLEERGRGDFKDLMSDLEVLENIHNRLHCFVGSRDHSPGSKSSSPCHDSIFTGLPARPSYASKHTQRLEAKCKVLDSVNQQLQTSLDNTDRKVQRLEAEVQELEAENQSLQATLEELRISARRLEQLETEKQSLEQETTALEKDKRQLEKENRRLRQQAEIQEANLDSSNVCMASLEREMRFLVKEVEGLRETAERVKGLERDNRELTKQAAIDHRTLATLREELVSEKLKTQQRDNELERLSHELEMKVLNQEESLHQVETPDTRFKMLESELESSLKKSLQIKEDKMATLEARLQESSTLNQKLRQELRTARLSCEVLQQRQQEEWTPSSSTPPMETSRAMSEWLRENQEATKELLKLKDRLIEVERNNATLEAERQAMKAQLKQLESQCVSQQAQILALQRQAASLQENNTALQTHNANLQVEKSTLSSQSASLMAQNAQLQQQQSGTESERDSAVREREELRGVHEQLLRDHERLAALHERQAMEYEALMGKHGCLKNAHRTLELEHRTLQDRYNSLLQQRTKLEDLERALREEQMRIALEKEQHKTTAAECCRLRDEKDWLNQTYRQLLSDNELLTTDHKQLKSQLNEAKLEHTWLEADFSKLKKEFQQLDITSTKLNNQCELLSQLKGNLEEENRHLLSQIETLMLQNRTLLEQTMESKDLFHVEERQYIDKLNDLRRQKEKLEEKIMDQYKFYEPSPPRRRGNWITLKLKKLMKSNSREHGLEQPSMPTHSGVAEHDSSSFLSSDGSGGSACNSAGDAMSPQRNNTTVKMFPRMRNRLKDRDKVKSIFRRSMSLSSLASPAASWVDGSQQLEGSEADVERDRKDTLTSSLTTSILSIHHLHHPTTPPSSGRLHTTTDTVRDVSELWETDKDSNDSAVPLGFEDNDELQNHALNGAQSRALSESSGEFSLSLENEPWSNGSSPIQHPPSRRSSPSYQPPSDTSTPQHRDKASTMPITSNHSSDLQAAPRQKDVGLSQDFWLTRGTKCIRKGSRGKVIRRSSDSGGAVKMNTGLSGMISKSSSSKVDTTRAIACSPITVLYVQGKASSMSGCLNCFSTPLGKEGQLKGPRSPKSLPRASSVISTAEGSSRRSSVNSECRVTMKTNRLQAQALEERNNQEETSSSNQQPHSDSKNSEPVPPLKPPRDPAVVVDCPKSPVQESLLGSSFTFNSVFSNTIFSDSVVTTTSGLDAPDNQTFLCLSPSLVRNCPGESQESSHNKPQTELGVDKEQSHNAEQAAGMEEKDKPLTIA